tara:strand:+ start:78 stop:422 length:345 start_codon:yes stop_codon:yes gene_type:complete
MGLVYFILCAYGMTQILVYGSVLKPLRPTSGKLGELFECPMCMGFWVGVFLFGVNGHTELFSFDYTFINALLLGCLSSGTSYILNMLFGDCGLKIQRTNNEKEKYTRGKTLLQG